MNLWEVIMIKFSVVVEVSMEETKYEEIRRSLTSKSLFPQVIENARNLVNIGARVDFKALINQYNSDETSLRDLFSISKDDIITTSFIPTYIGGSIGDMAIDADKTYITIKKIG